MNKIKEATKEAYKELRERHLEEYNHILKSKIREIEEYGGILR